MKGEGQGTLSRRNDGCDGARLTGSLFALGATFVRRSQRGLTQQELGSRCAISQAVISRIEAGKTSPNLEQLTRLGRALRMPVQWFLSGSAWPGEEARHSGHRVVQPRHCRFAGIRRCAPRGLPSPRAGGGSCRGRQSAGPASYRGPAGCAGVESPQRRSPSGLWPGCRPARHRAWRGWRTWC